MRKYLFMILLFFMLSLLTIPLAEASFAVSSLYSDNFPLKVRPGETLDAFFLLHNVLQEKSIIIEAEIALGGEIFSLSDVDPVYDVFEGNVEVPIIIEIPESDEVGREYEVGVLFKSFPEEGEGDVQIKANIVKTFPVVVVGTETEQKQEIVSESPDFDKAGIVWILLISIISALILAVVILIFVFLTKKRSLGSSEEGIQEDLVYSSF